MHVALQGLAPQSPDTKEHCTCDLSHLEVHGHHGIKVLLCHFQEGCGLHDACYMSQAQLLIVNGVPC